MSEGSHLFAVPEDRVRIEALEDGVRLTLPGGPAELSGDEALAVSAGIIDALAKDEETAHWRRIPVQFLEFEAERGPDEDAEITEQTASIRCWISGQTKANAVYI